MPQTGLNSSALRAQLQDAARYLEGDEQQMLQRIDASGAALGDPVAFNHDHHTRDTEHTDAGTWIREDMLVSTRSQLVLNATYTWGGKAWVAGESGSHHVGNEPGVYHYSLTMLVS